MTPEQQKVAAKIAAILNSKNARGEFIYTKQEVRDFTCAVIFELQLPTPPELLPTINEFLQPLGIPETASDDDIILYIRTYFEQNPLNKALLAAMQEMAVGNLFQDQVRNDATATKVRQLMSTGKAEQIRAPAEEKKAGPQVKARRGLFKPR